MRTPFPGRRDFHRGHSGSGGGFDAHVGVLEDEAGCGRDAESGGCKQKRFRIGLPFRVVLGADQRIESIEELQRSKRRHHRFPRAARHDGKWNPSVLGLDMLDDYVSGPIGVAASYSLSAGKIAQKFNSKQIRGYNRSS